MEFNSGDIVYKYHIIGIDHIDGKAKKNMYKFITQDNATIIAREDFLEIASTCDINDKSLEYDRYFGDIIGNNRDFGKLIPIKYEFHNNKSPKYERKDFYRCKCTNCGNLILLTRRQLTIEGKKDCGCSYNDLSNIPGGFYDSYHHMKGRCTRSTDSRYNAYGGRGITVCDEWKIWKNFVNDMLDEYLEACKLYGKNNVTIERKDVNKGYYKENCCWISKADQAKNKQNTKHYTIGKEDKIYTSGELLRKFADPSINYYKLRQRLEESKKYCINGNIHNPNIFIDTKYRDTLYKPIRYIGEDNNCPIKFIDKNNVYEYRNTILPTEFKFYSKQEIL